MTNHLEWINSINLLAILWLLLQYNKLQTYCIVQALLIDNILNLDLLTSLSSHQHAVVLRYNVDTIPTLCNALLPECNLLSKCIVVSAQLLEAGSLLIVELIIVVIQLALHCIVRSDSSNRVLYYLDPLLAEAFLILVVIHRDDVVLQEVVDSSSIKLILVTLVLVCTLLRKSPTSTLAVTFYPPTIKYREVDNTIHLSLLARCTRSLQWTCRSIHPDINT